VKVDPSLNKIKEIFPINSSKFSIKKRRRNDPHDYILDPGVESGLSYLEVIAIAVIVLGCVLFIIGFLGCCGAIKQWTICLVLVS
jgi:hypothetical protein